MTPNTTTTKGEALANFGQSRKGFKSATHKGIAACKCAISGRARQALELLLRAGAKGVTQAQALIEGNGWRLAASICVLRKLGFLIESRPFPTGRGGQAARYVLKGHCAHSMAEDQQ